MEFKLDIVQCQSKADIDEKLSAALDRYQEVFPSYTDANILINLHHNTHMNAPTATPTALPTHPPHPTSLDHRLPILPLPRHF